MEKSVVQSEIESKLAGDLSPEFLNVVNESHMHGGPATDSHFNITLVAATFDQLSLVKRHQHVYGLLSEQMAAGVHALALHLYSPPEWQERDQSSPDSPDCKGGSKQD